MQVGALEACVLAKKGYEVDLYEFREGMKLYAFGQSLQIMQFSISNESSEVFESSIPTIKCGEITFLRALFILNMDFTK